jgi:hypothetical protein
VQDFMLKKTIVEEKFKKIFSKMKQNNIFVPISVLTILLTVSFVAEAQRQKIKGRTQSTIDQEESIVSFHLKYFFCQMSVKMIHPTVLAIRFRF